jgi:hypothetical protein
MQLMSDRSAELLQERNRLQEEAAEAAAEAAAAKRREAELQAEVGRLEDELSLQRFEQDTLAVSSSHKLAFNNFAVNDVVLFLRNPQRNQQLEAFNIGCPYYFLSQESQEDWRRRQQRKQEREDERVARATAEGRDAEESKQQHRPGQPPAATAVAAASSSSSVAAVVPAAAAPSSPSSSSHPSSSSSSSSPPPSSPPYTFGEFLGQIILISRLEADADAAKRFNVPLGTICHELTVQIVEGEE